jgi:predicted nucleotidyltransferase
MDEATDGPHARAPELSDLVRICRSLNRAGARYVVIGGFAVIAHGAVRTTKDIDLLIEDSPENVERVKDALCVLEDQAARDVGADDIRNYSVVRVADEIVVDLMGRACGLSYSDVAEDAEEIELEDVAIPIASKRALIRTKDTFRPSDRADREFLEQRIAAERDQTR